MHTLTSHLLIQFLPSSNNIEKPVLKAGKVHGLHVLGTALCLKKPTDPSQNKQRPYNTSKEKLHH